MTHLKKSSQVELDKMIDKLKRLYSKRELMELLILRKIKHQRA